MKKTIYLGKLFFILLLISALTLLSVSAGGEIITKISITLDGINILSENTEALLINGVTYVPLRAFCEELGNTDIYWNSDSRTAKAKTAGLDILAKENSPYILVNNRPFYSGAQNLLNNGSIYVPVRSIAKAYGLEVNWKEGENGRGYVSLTSALGRAENAEDVYDYEVLYWLSRIISAESRGESLLGQIAVGNVVLNRTRDEGFPDTVYDVIFDRKFGVQFTPISNGTIYEEPAESSIIAAKICLEGYSISDKILYFLNEAISTNMWVSNNRPYVMTLGNHTFYS